MKVDYEKLAAFIAAPFDARAKVPRFPFILGIDPGTTGGMALLRSDRKVFVFDMPVYKKPQKGNKKKNTIEFDYEEIIAIFKAMRPIHKRLKVVLEKSISVMPAGGGFSARNIAYTAMRTAAGHYIWPMFLSSLGIETAYPYPNTWKQRLGLDRDKAKSFAFARKWVPSSAEWLTAQRHHNRAEAVALAYWGFLPDVKPNGKRKPGRATGETP